MQAISKSFRTQRNPAEINEVASVALPLEMSKILVDVTGMEAQTRTSTLGGSRNVSKKFLRTTSTPEGTDQRAMKRSIAGLEGKGIYTKAFQRAASF